MSTIKLIILLIIGIWNVNGDNIISSIPSVEQIFGKITNVSKGVINAAADAINLEEQELLRFEIEPLIRKALNKIKELMVNEIELLGLPRLEPYHIGHWDIDIMHEIGIFKGALDNLEVKELSKFETNDVIVTSRSWNWDIVLNITFNTLYVSGDYDLDAELANLFYVFGNGPFNLTLNDLNVIISVKNLKLIQLKHFHLDELGFKIHLKALKSNVTNLEGGGSIEELFNKAIENVGPEAIDEVWPDVEPIISKYFLDETNEVLSKVTLSELMKLLIIE